MLQGEEIYKTVLSVNVVLLRTTHTLRWKQVILGRNIFFIHWVVNKLAKVAVLAVSGVVETPPSESESESKSSPTESEFKSLEFESNSPYGKVYT